MLTLSLATISRGTALTVMAISAALLVVALIVLIMALTVGKEADRKMQDLLADPQPFECDYCTRKAVIVTADGKACSLHAHHLGEEDA